MDMNIIKEYLIGLGFKVNDDSLNNAKQSISSAEGMIKNFANSNKDNMSSMQSFFKLFNSSIKDNLGIVSKIIPEAKLPLLQVVSFAELLYKGIDKVSKGFKNVNTDKLKESKNRTEEASNSMKSFSKKTEEAKSPITELIALIKELNVSINNLSQNIKLNVDSESVKNASATVEDLNKKSDDSTKSLENLNTSSKKLDSKEIKNASNNMQRFSGKIKETQSPMLWLIGIVRELTSGIGKLSTNLDKVKFNKLKLPENIPKINLGKKQTPTNMTPELSKTSTALKVLDKNSGDTTKALKLLKDNGGKAVEEFAEGTGVSLGIVVAGFAAFTVTVISLWKTLTSLANQDLGYQKLAMQLWTTKENAREIDMALKTMKVSMQDLWLSPELLQQFNQLRQDSAQLKLPSDYEDNLKLVRSIGFEFQRLKQAGTLAFQWIGYYIAKYAAGPLANIHEALDSFTNGVLKNIPSAAKVIGTVLGIIFRLILTIIETVGILVKPIISIIKFVLDGLSKIPGPMQNIIKLIGIIGAAIMMGPLGAILLLLLALDDVFTYMKGGHSVLGKFFDKFKEGSKVINNIKQKFKDMKNELLAPIHALEDGWNSFWKGIETYIDNIEKKFKKLEDDIKNSPLGKALSKVENAIPNAKSKVEGFTNSIKKDASNVFSYIMPQTTTNNKSSTSNTTHNSQSNTFNIYGTNANSTASAVTNKMGIQTRNLQGVID